jgi:hypothetical protein
MATRSLTPTVRPFAAHPIARTRETADWEAYRRAADTACAIEAELAKVRRLARIEPAPAFARTVELAVHEVRVVAARYWSRDVERWQSSVMKELGGLLFEHVAEVEVEVRVVGRDLHLARRDGDA